jgi:hypothetical protein
MVDLQTYRCRIGQHCHKVSRYRLGGQGHLTMQDIFIIVYNIFLSLLSSSYFYGVGLLIGLFYSMILCLALTQSTPVSLPRPSTQLFSSHSPFYKVPLIAMYHIKVYNVVLMFFSFRFLCRKHARYVHKISRLLWFRSFSLYISNTCTFKSLYLKFGSNKRFNILVANIIMWLSLLNFLLISIVNPSMLNPGPNNLSVLYQNVRGLVPFSHLRYDNPSLDVNKILELQSFVAIEKPDIVALNETWLKPSIGNNEIFSDNQYKIFRADRSKKTHPPDPLVTAKIRENGGGVLLGIRSDLDVVSKNVKVPLGVEMIAIQLTFSNGEKAVICTCYRVGTLGTVNCEKIAEFLRSFLSKRRPPKLYMIGDFNLARAVWDNPRSPVPIEQNFIDNFSELGLTQCITTPTHIKGNILDILLTNADNLVNDINVRDRDSICKSDHFPITFNISGRSRYKNSAKRKCYNFKRANWDALNHDLRNVDWSPLNCCEIETGWELIKSRLFELVDEHIPVVHIKSEFQPPWFDSDTFNFCRKKERLRQKFKRTGELKHELEFVKCRRDFKKLVSHKMRENLSNDDDPALITKKFWSYVKSKSQSSRIPECVGYKNILRSSPVDQANLFNTFFHEQFSEASRYNIDIDYSSDSRFDICFAVDRVRMLLSRINSNKAQGPDGIHGMILKKCAVGLAYPLSMLYKLSYNTGHLPAEWKVANVVPIHKKGSKSSVENYRPISLTCLVMKVFERIIKEELLKHTSHLINSYQHGFLASRSCSTNMVGFCDNLALSLNDNERTDVVYFDFAKAFDSVNHDLILYKLKHNFGVDGTLLKFLASYLQNRKQRVVINGKFSDFVNVDSGVPQGSIIGPILFVLFINDLSDGLSPGTNVALYADDTKLSRKIVCENDHLVLQDDINYLYNWATSNKMIFHPGKCKVLSVSPHPPPFVDVLPLVQFYYCLGDCILDYTVCEKDLGVDMVPTLNFSSQCDRLFSKANQKIGLIRRNCFFVTSTKQRRVLYITLVRSLFESCSIIWRPSTNQSIISKLESIQKKSIKWILREEHLSYSCWLVYLQKCKEVELLPLINRFELNDLVFFHKVVNNVVQVEMPSYLNPPTGTSRLRSSHLDSKSFVSSITPNSSSGAFSKSFFYRTHHLWNRLPFDIRSTFDSISFRSQVTDYLWKNLATDMDDSF